MGASKYTVFRILDMVFLSTVFIVQSVILSQYTIYSQYHSELPSDYVNPVLQKLLWLIGDFICLAGFLLACLCGFRHVSRQRDLQKSRGDLKALALSTNTVKNETQGPSSCSNGKLSEEIAHKNSILGYVASSRIPLCYISWFSYASFLVLKIVLIFTSDLSQKWRKSEENQETVWFGPQVLQLGIGISAVIFSLLIEAHHDAGKQDPRRNAYLNSVSYEVALEILDTACLLSFLISSFDHEGKHTRAGEVCPSSLLTPHIITLSAVNLILPSVTLYKLTSTNFGETYHVKLEMIYKSLHFLLVNLPFLMIRVYLWNANDREDVIFIIKNIYGIVGYLRGVYSDLQILRKEGMKEDENGSSGSKAGSKINVNNRRGDNGETKGDSVEMSKLM